MEGIRCAGLTKRYGDIHALRGLDLTVEPGQVYGFLGPNGSGKTTTMRILAGLVRATSGRAWVSGRPLPDPDGLPRIGTMIEEPAFHPWLSGWQNLQVLALSGPRITTSHAIPRVLERVGLSEVAERRTKGYSQGMRQRLGLAAALLRDPEVLVLDEPANGLDPAGIRQFRSLFRELADAGKTVFLSSHLLTEVERICDRVAVVHQGRVVQEGSVATLLTARASVRVVVPADELGRARELLARWPVRTEGSGELLVAASEAGEVNRALAAGGVWAEELAAVRPDLEQAFLDLTDTATGTNTDTNTDTDTQEDPDAADRS
jgi:ABC-2 type transport system ATP-binding protein